MSGDLKCSACGYVVYPQEQETCGALERNGYHWCKGELRDNREQARLARIQEQSRQLSLEECVYWVCIAGQTWTAEVIVRRNVGQIKKHAEQARKTMHKILCNLRRDYQHGSWAWGNRREFARRLATVDFLCREALLRIKELQR